MAPSTTYSSAKELFDRIGGTVQQQVHTAAHQFRNELLGHLSSATFREGRMIESGKAELCQLNHDFHTNVTDGNSDPCFSRVKDRFSDTKGSECDNSIIKGNKGKECGACAPYRRLHLCDQNLEHIDPEKITSTHNLLVDVLLGAQYEGQSIRTQYQQKKDDYKSGLCTALARSFADIGDIIRGKDLFLGNNKEKKKLQKKLIQYFEKIHGGLTGGAKIHYGGDPDFLKLREDWWDANRQEIWNSIICKAEQNDKYFRESSSNKGGTYEKCRCHSGSVLTNFDYVPQYLRWFEEWAEDFCRKKKKNLPHVRTNCRGDYYGEPRYCSGNGYDCEQTINRIGHLVIDKGCTKCSVWCRLYESWIDNQKQEFIKQKEKYAKEILGNGRRKRSASNNYEGYDRKFYDELKKYGYDDVNKFMQLLNEEKECKAISEEKEKIDFTKNVEDDKNINNEGTFYHSEYCQPCPECGVKLIEDKWEKKPLDDKCRRKERKRGKTKKITEIPFLFNDKKGKDIVTKLSKFCYSQGSDNNKDKGIEEWKCSHYSVNDDECVMQNNGASAESHPKIMPFVDFFQFWVTHLFNDVVEWRNEISKCITESSLTKCNNRCNRHCKCFPKWVDQKKKEWKQIKEHYQYEEGFNQFDPHDTLEYILENDFFEDIKKAYGNEEEIDRIKKLTRTDPSKKQENTENDKYAIDVLLEDEEKDANTCTGTHNDERCNKPPEDKNRGRSLPPADGDGHDSEEEEDDDHVDGQQEESLPDETEVVEETVAEVTEVEAVKPPCEIVNTLFTSDDTTALQEACQQKYGLPQRHWGWKCVDTTTGGETTGSSGATCIPPRRRKLYVTPLTKWADKVTTQARGSVGSLDIASSSNPRDDADSALRDAFIKSAAIETFFLWHKYKAENTKKPEDTQLLGFGSSGFGMTTLAPGVAAQASLSHLPLANGAGLGGHNGVKGPVGEEGMQEGEDGVKEPRGRLGQEDDITSQLSPQHPTAAFRDVKAVSFTPGSTIFGEQDGGSSHVPRLLPNGATLGSLPTGTSDPLDSNHPDNLRSGKIPPPFLRQMFYTISDYRDILMGNTDMVGDTIISNTSNNEASSSVKTETKISKIIEDFLKKHSGSSHSHSDTSTQNSGDKPSEWWDKNAKYIWDGMVCALTYEEKDPETEAIGSYAKTISQDDNLKGALLDTTGKKPKPKTDNGHEYTYEKVVLKDEEQNGPKGASPRTEPTKLTDFVKRPPFFRYLQEWGEEFCKKRTEKLKNVMHNCRDRDNPGHEYCGGDGHDCRVGYLKHNDMFANLDCPRCYKQCTKYRKWIQKKEKEFNKQNNKYDGELKKLQNRNSSGGDNCCKEIEKHTSAASFLKELKHCTNDQTDEGKKSNDKDNEINFEHPENTFNPSTYCKACPIYGVNCNGKGGICKIITKTDLNGEKHKDFTNIKMLVLSRKGEDKNDDQELKEVNNDCKNTGLLEDTCVQNWTCQKKDGVHECNLNDASKSAESFDSKYFEKKISFKILFHSWVIDFIQYYNKSKEIISRCTNDKNSCKQVCNNKCDYVKKWLDIKEGEWKNIKDYYNVIYIGPDEHIASRLNSFFEQEPFHSLAEEAKKVVKCKDEQDKLWGCTGDNLKDVKDQKPENCNKGDFITNLIDKLKKKATSCPGKPSGENLAQTCQEPLLVEDEDDTLHEEIEVKAPNICPPPIQQPEEEDEKCEAPTTPKEPAPTTPKEPAPTTPKKPAPEKKVEPPPKPRRRTPRQPKKSLLPPILGASGFPWTVGIAFAALSYFILKKKTKSSVGNLFQILQIPKSDYDIPTLKSSNRYIPYASDRYKGKTYIYMEGDSSGEEKYAFMSDTTDVTSSESEYEELDINDIYVPGSPKYKTLIEVVLEPSKRDTPSSDTPTNKFTDEEWNQLKHDFISNMLQNQPNDVPNDYKSGDIPLNTQPNTLYFNKPEEKPFITSIHDRNLYSGEEYSYNVNMVNSMDDIPISGKNDVYSGIDLINDSLNNNNVDIYDELLKRKENELFGTNHPKHTNTHNVTKSSNSDPIDNQLDLFHTWLDRHRDMCEQWNNKEEVLDKLKEEWNKDNNSGNIPSDSNKTLNTDVSIQIHMDNPKPTNEFTNMDTILEDLEKYNEPYYDVQDDIYYDVHDHVASNTDSNAMDVPSKVQIEMDINTKLVKEKYPIADVWDI